MGTDDLQEQPLHEAVSNAKPKSQIEVKVKSGALLFYRPQTHELVTVPPEFAAAFENECRLMDMLVQDFRLAKENHLQAADELLKTQRRADGPGRAVPQDPRLLSQAEQNLTQANQALEEKQKALMDNIEPLGELDPTGDKILELIPLAPQGKRSQWSHGKKWTYVRSQKVKSHMRGYALNADERSRHQGNAESSILKNGKIDTAKLRTQINNLEATGKIAEIHKDGVLWPELNESIKSSLDAWANGLNQGRSRVELKPEAQLLRYFAGAGLQTEWKPREGKVALRGNVRGEFMVAEGKFTAGCYWPDRAGVMWALTGAQSGTQHKIGLMRLAAEMEMFGLAGASAVAELDVEVDYTRLAEGKTGMRGRRRTPSKTPRQVDIAKKARDGAAVNVGGDVFAGVRVGGGVKGKIQWNSPEAKEFTDLALIGPGVALQAGVGIGGQVAITFMGGKFRVLLVASACFGPGARGKLELEVDFAKTLEFCQYLAHALYATGYEFMAIIADDGFKAWKSYTLWAIQTGEDIGKTIKRLEDGFDDVLKDLLKQFEKEEARIQLMNRVLSRPRILDFSPPETKAMILYQLTRHSWLTKTVLVGENQGLSPETLKRRKEAVLVVCKKARSKAEFRNIMQHMTANGRKRAEDWETSFDHVKRFMNMGYDPADYDQQVKDYFEALPTEHPPLDALYTRLYDEPVLGYAFVDNDERQYLANAQTGDHDGYFVAGGYKPGDASPGVTVA